jgi:uncharacterized membrane protein YhaH (DUF805 family)
LCPFGTQNIRKAQRVLSRNLSAFAYRALYLISAREGGVSLVNLLFGFNGRIYRTQYWLGSFGVGFAAIVLNVIVSMAAAPSATMVTKEAAAQAAPMLLIVLGLISMVAGWAGTALQWKRFHDRGRPGWIAFTPILPAMMIAVSIVGHALEGAPFGAMIAGVMPWVFLLLAINLYFFIELGCLAGNAGPNTYGDPPGSGSGSHAPAPQAPRTPSGQAPATAMSSLFSAQSAMDRAIAEHETHPVARSAMVVAAVAAAPGGAPSFGRKRV